MTTAEDFSVPVLALLRLRTGDLAALSGELTGDSNACCLLLAVVGSDEPDVGLL